MAYLCRTLRHVHPRGAFLFVRRIHQSCVVRSYAPASEYDPPAVEDLLYRRKNTPDLEESFSKAKYAKDLNEVPPEQRRLLRPLKECADTLDWQRALDLFRTQIPEGAGEEWQVVARNVLHCLCKSMRYFEAKEVFHSLPTKDTVAYNMMLLMLAKLRRTREFEEVLQRMDEEGVPRSHVTYCQIMSKCKESRDWEGALRNLETLISDPSLSEEVSRWSFLYLGAMSACAKARQPGHVAKLMQDLRDKDPKGVLPNHWNSLIISCAPDGERANRAMQEMRDAGFTPTAPDYRSLMVCHRNPAEQQKIYQLMRQEFPRTDPEEAWAILLRTAVLNEDAEAVQWLDEEMHSHGCPMDSDRVRSVPPLRRAVQMLREWQQTQQLRESMKLPLTSTKQAQPEQSPVQPEKPLPSGWQSTIDPATGHPYYWRVDDPANTTTWDRPSQI